MLQRSYVLGERIDIPVVITIGPEELPKVPTAATRLKDFLDSNLDEATKNQLTVLAKVYGDEVAVKAMQASFDSGKTSLADLVTSQTKAQKDHYVKFAKQNPKTAAAVVVLTIASMGYFKVKISVPDADKIPGRVQSRINIALKNTEKTPKRKSGEPFSAGFEHLEKKHINGTLANNNSVFNISAEKVKEILQSKTVVNSPVKNMGDGTFVRVVDTGTVIGNASLKEGGGLTKTIKVFTDEAGNLINAYPVK